MNEHEQRRFGWSVGVVANLAPHPTSTQKRTCQVLLCKLRVGWGLDVECDVGGYTDCHLSCYVV